MNHSEQKINSILKDLTNVHENLLSLSDDIWQSIDHNNTEKLEEGVAFKKQFNSLLDKFVENAQDISVLVTQFTGVKDEELTVTKTESENERIIKELDKDVPHSITEDFTYKRPYAFIIEKHAFTNTTTWKDIYVQFCRYLSNKDSNKLSQLADNPDFFSKQNRKYYSADHATLRVPALIMKDFYIETNLSARDTAERIKFLLQYYDISKDELCVYLRQDRNA